MINVVVTTQERNLNTFLPLLLKFANSERPDDVSLTKRLHGFLVRRKLCGIFSSSSFVLVCGF